MSVPAPPRLIPGELFRCPHCQRDHVVEQPYAAASTADREFMYVRCRGDLYFVGFVRRPSDR